MDHKEKAASKCPAYTLCFVYKASQDAPHEVCSLDKEMFYVGVGKNL